MSEFGVAESVRIRETERAIDDRPLARNMTRREHVLQTRALKSILRRGTALPGGAQVTQTNGEPDSVIGEMGNIAHRCWGGATPNWAETQAGARINAALGRTNFAADMIQVNHQETQGLNMNWTGNVTLRIENPQPIASGTGSMTAAGGGSSANQTGTSSSSTDSAGVSGEVSGGGHEGAVGGKAGATASSSTTTGRSDQVTDTGNSTTSAQTTDTLRRFRATIVANITLRCEPDFAGSDYVNPFKWGFAGAGAAAGPSSASNSVTAGTVEYQVSTGIAPAAAGH